MFKSVTSNRTKAYTSTCLRSRTLPQYKPTIRKMSSKPEDPLIFAPETYQYTKGHLDESEINSDPFKQFHIWFKQAQNELPHESAVIPESTTFSTARLPSGRVSSRVVLLKELDHSGFIVYSNWETSKKNADYQSNKYASLTFFWPHVQRQVRVEGLMEKVDRETTERYFTTRPRGSKIGAWTSPQSQVIESRSQLNDLNDHYTEKFKDLKDNEIPCPENWGGMRIVPLEIEFWQGGLSRLHDRITYTRENTSDEQWAKSRLSP